MPITAVLLWKKIGVESIKSLAYWTSKRQSQSSKSYLLYEKIPATMSAYDLCLQLDKKNPNGKVIIDLIAKKLAATVRKIHANNIRHGDPHDSNFLISSPISQTEQLTADSVTHMSFALIDLDKIQFGDKENSWLKKNTQPALPATIPRTRHRRHCRLTLLSGQTSRPAGQSYP